MKSDPTFPSHLFRLIAVAALLIGLPSTSRAAGQECATLFGARQVSKPAKPMILENVRAEVRESWKQWRTQVAKNKGLKVLWWNIADGQLADANGVNVLGANLERLAASNICPDVMMFGEFSEKALPENTKANLKNFFPFEEFVSYNSQTPDHGIKIYSKYPMTDIRQEILPWVPGHLSTADRLAYNNKWAAPLGDSALPFYNRTAREMEITWNGRKISLIPLHLSEPWKAMTTEVKTPQSPAGAFMQKFLNKSEIANEVLFGQGNPLITQVRSLLSWLDDGSNRSRIILGNFNLPGNIGPLSPAAYQLLTSHLEQALQTSTPSFPTMSSPLSKSYPPVQIDHAFTQGNLRGTIGHVLPLQGSDHYPIYSVFN